MLMKPAFSLLLLMFALPSPSPASPGGWVEGGSGVLFSALP